MNMAMSCPPRATPPAFATVFNTSQISSSYTIRPVLFGGCRHRFRPFMEDMHEDVPDIGG
jgi:hypothetical protein